MGLLSLVQLGILLIAQSTVQATPWDTKLPRYEGYDLERGPVFYEAYYPDEQSTNENTEGEYQEKRFFDRPNVQEMSYQVPADSYGLPYKPEVRVAEEEYRKRGYNLPIAGYYPIFTTNRLQSIQGDHRRIQGKENREYSVREESLNSQANGELSKDVRMNDYVIQEKPSAYGFQNQDGNAYTGRGQGDSGRRNFQQYGPPRNLIVFGEPPIPEPSNVRVVNDGFGPSNHRGGLEAQRFEGNLKSEYNPAMKTPSLPTENIFGPRPQVINYVFSSQKRLNTLKPAVLVEEPESNEWPRNYGDNIIEEDIRKEDEQELKKDEAKIASIQVSEVTHHKIRHHHGEKQRRNFGQH